LQEAIGQALRTITAQDAAADGLPIADITQTYAETMYFIVFYEEEGIERRNKMVAGNGTMVAKRNMKRVKGDTHGTATFRPGMGRSGCHFSAAGERRRGRRTRG
jgi:hypothetical protein